MCAVIYFFIYNLLLLSIWLIFFFVSAVFEKCTKWIYLSLAWIYKLFYEYKMIIKAKERGNHQNRYIMTRPVHWWRHDKNHTMKMNESYVHVCTCLKNDTLAQVALFIHIDVCVRMQGMQKCRSTFVSHPRFDSHPLGRALSVA